MDDGFGDGEDLTFVRLWPTFLGHRVTAVPGGSEATTSGGVATGHTIGDGCPSEQERRENGPQYDG